MDVSDKNMFQKFGNSLVNLFARFGLCTVKIIAAVMLGIIKGAEFILSELRDLILAILKGGLWLFVGMTESIRDRINKNKELQIAAKKAKKQGNAAYAKAMGHFFGSFLLGENGILYTAFNYTLPILSIAFLIGIVRIGSSYEYGISVEYNGREIGVISDEADFEEAEREVQQRISYLSDDKKLDFDTNFSLKIMSDDDKIMSSAQLANEMLAASDEELTEAYGIYIDGKFIGAVNDCDAVQEALDNRLLNYHVEGNVKEVSYKNKVEYTKGIYLAESVMEQQKVIELLTSSTVKKDVYIAQPDDTAVTIAQKYNMSLDDFEKLNPSIKGRIRNGQVVNITKTESYLPIQYIKEYETLSFMDYETVEIETSSLSVGSRAVMVNGVMGEKRNTLEVTYVDGVERSKKTIKSVVTKEPVVEQVGIGTYAARPDPGVRPITGSGEFSWPVDGGWISDIFGGERNHKGLDIAAPGGTDIYASADGIVVAAGWNPGGYGYFVQIDHLNGYQTVYGHMSTVYAVVDQPVTRGQLIGAVGTTGHSTGNHCHFEVRYMNVCRNPEIYLNTTQAYMDDNDEEKDKDKDKKQN